MVVLLLGQKVTPATIADPNGVQLKTGSCGLHLVLVTSQSTIPKYEGSSAVLVYGCSAGGSPALITTGKSGSVKVIPYFIAPDGWTLSIAQSESKSSCSGPLTTLVSGSVLNLPAGHDYDYCLTTSVATSFLSFGILWVS